MSASLSRRQRQQRQDWSRYYRRGLSLAQIATITGYPYSRVRRVLLAAGVVLRTPVEGKRLRGVAASSRRWAA